MADLPRILLCCFDVLPSPTGFSRRVTEYLKALEGLYSVVVLSIKTHDVSHIERFHGSRLLRVPVGIGDLPSRLQAFERAVRRQLDSEEYVLAHFTDPFGGYTLCESKAQHDYRVVYEALTLPSNELATLHPSAAADRKFVSRVRRQELFCLMNADRVLTANPVTSRYVQSLGVNENVVEVLRAPVELGPYATVPLGKADDATLKLVYLGSQVAWQGVETLLDALKLARRETKVHLTLLGPRHPQTQLKIDEQVRGMTSEVRFQAPVSHDELAQALASADVGVIPLSNAERNRLQGGALAKASEYFAAGLPVIASDLPMTRELLPESCTVFFPPENAEELAARIVELAGAPAARREMSTQARAEAALHLASSSIQAQLLRVYQTLLGPRPLIKRSAEHRAPTLTATPTSLVREPANSSRSRRKTDKTDPFIQGEARAPRKGDTDPATPAHGARIADTDPGSPAPQAALVRRDTPPPTIIEKNPAPRVASSGLIPLPTALRALPPIRGGIKRNAAPTVEGPVEISSDEIMEFDEVSMVSRMTRIDPWFALLVHGYCPPDGTQFERHTPPTNFPGRDEPAPESAADPSQVKPPVG